MANDFVYIEVNSEPYRMSCSGAYYDESDHYLSLSFVYGKEYTGNGQWRGWRVGLDHVITSGTTNLNESILGKYDLLLETYCAQKTYFNAMKQKVGKVIE